MFGATAGWAQAVSHDHTSTGEPISLIHCVLQVLFTAELQQQRETTTGRREREKQVEGERDGEELGPAWKRKKGNGGHVLPQSRRRSNRLRSQ